MSITLTFAILIGFYAVSSYFVGSIVKHQSEEVSRSVSELTFNSMFQIMKNGWSRQEMNDFIEATKNASKNGSLEVMIARSPVVEKLFGKVEQSVSDPMVASTLNEGIINSKHEGSSTTQVYPIKARNECVACHTNARVGDTLGAITVHQNLSELEAQTKKIYYWMLLALAPLPLILGYFATLYVARRINNSILGIEKAIDDITSVKDLMELEFGAKHNNFIEIETIFGKIGQLAQKIKTIAADKELLEFEVKLLDKFIITSEVVRDWREHIKELLLEINQVLEAYSLFVIFKIEEENYELEIFWRNTPSERTILLFEASVDRRVRENPYFGDETTFAVRHHIADQSKRLPELSSEDIELQTKSLLLSTPKIGGVVGIGVQALMSKDPMRHIVIESILTTLVNVVGSVKAIYKYTQDLEYYATRDPLTNLYNQRAFRELLSYEITRSERKEYCFSLLMIDFDNFKLINDNYGHAFGDDYLKAFAECIKSTLTNEAIFARYGGDEFSVIIPDADQTDAMVMAEQVRKTVEEFALEAIDGRSVTATISIGIATYPTHAQNESELFLISDSMMYKAKQEGKNVIHAPTGSDIVETFKKEHQKTQIVLSALEHKALIPHYQPIINLQTGETHIHELLMRIKVEDNMMTAGEFIEAAERVGVIHKMDYILIEKAFAKIAEEDYKHLIFINLSPKALIIGEFISNIKALAIKYNIDPERVVLEITERDTVKNVGLLEKFVQDLKIEGFKFAIDDFGSGFSSFHYVKRFPIDYIKVEGEFIRNMSQDIVYMAFVKSIVTLAKELGIKTVAEYVEDEETLKLVKMLGIDFAQGYLIGRPSEHFAR